MNGHVVLYVLLFAQIDVPIPAHERYTMADLQRRRPTTISSDDPDTRPQYTIQPYLQVASDLQAMPEVQRVATLAVWARIDSLAEPTMILCRMLMEKADGTPLRRRLLRDAQS